MNANKNILETYSRINAVKDQCLKNKTSYFVAHSEQSTKITNKRLDEEQTVAIVMNDAEGPDSAFVFSLMDTDLRVGDYFTLKETSTFLIYEKVRIIKDVDFNKFKAFECNVKINDDFYGYLMGSKQAAKDIKMSNRFETSRLLPVLICPSSCGLQIDDQVTIQNQVWDLVECDDISNPGICYFTIERGTNKMSSIVKHMPKDNKGIVYTGTTCTVETEEGWYSSETDLKLVDRTENTITFKVPDNDFEIEIMEKGKKVNKKFVVKENR